MMNMEQHTRLVLDTTTKLTKPKISASFLLALVLITFVACSQDTGIYALDETPPVNTAEDAADDPAIIINYKNPSASLFFGTDKTAGVYLYDLKGAQQSFSPLGAINNIDVRQQNSEIYLAATNRSNQSVEYWVIDQDTFFANTHESQDIFSLSKRSFSMASNIDIYGICIGMIGGTPVAFVTEDRGPRVELWTLENQKLIGAFDNGGESEGCVFDDENKTLFISEEETNGVLKAYDLNQEYPFANPAIVDSREGNIGGDPEGVAIYKTSDTEGYVLLSSQGDNKFNVYNRQKPYQFISSFTVDDSSRGIDRTSHTDGISVSSYNFGGKYTKGMMIAQDDENLDGEELKNQNFKIIPFNEVLKALK